MFKCLNYYHIYNCMYIMYIIRIVYHTYMYRFWHSISKVHCLLWRCCSTIFSFSIGIQYNCQYENLNIILKPLNYWMFIYTFLASSHRRQCRKASIHFYVYLVLKFTCLQESEKSLDFVNCLMFFGIFGLFNPKMKQIQKSLQILKQIPFP